MAPDRLSIAQARRIALAAQGFTDRRPAAAPTMTHLKRVVGRTRLLQMDSVNIAARAHFMPLFSRLGAYDPDLLHRAAWQPGRGRRLLVEYWAHEAALIPVSDWPLFRWRMDEFAEGRYRHTREVMRRNRSLVGDVRAVIENVGATTPRAIEAELGIEREPGAAGSWWQRGEVKHLCEAMFAAGDLSAVRNGNFVRHYDLTERVVGADTLALVADAVAAVAEGADAAIPAAMAKSHTCSAAVNIAGKAMQLHGGIGYTWESGIHTYLKRATLNRSLFGSPATQRQRLSQRYH